MSSSLRTARTPRRRHRVSVTDQLAEVLDWSTFQLSEIAWGDVVHSVGLGTYAYAASVYVPDYRPG